MMKRAAFLVIVMVLVACTISLPNISELAENNGPMIVVRPNVTPESSKTITPENYPATLTAFVQNDTRWAVIVPETLDGCKVNSFRGEDYLEEDLNILLSKENEIFDWWFQIFSATRSLITSSGLR